MSLELCNAADFRRQPTTCTGPGLACSVAAAGSATALQHPHLPPAPRPAHILPHRRRRATSTARRGSRMMTKPRSGPWPVTLALVRAAHQDRCACGAVAVHRGGQ